MVQLRLSILIAAFTTLLHAADEATLRTFAGTGTKGFSGDGGSAIAAQLNDPTGVVRGTDGSLYVCDTANHRIRKITPEGTILTIAGNGERGWSGDGGPATAASLNEPYEVRLDSKGNVFWVERLSHTVRKLDTQTGVITTVAGNGTRGFSGDGGPAIEAQLNDPHSIAFDRDGNLFIADVRNHRVRQINMRNGIISTFSGTGERQPTPDGSRISGAPLSGPRALDFDNDGNLWLALREGNAVLKFDMANGSIHHIAGTGEKGYTGDGGAAAKAALNGPKGIAVAPNGNVYVVDTENHVIRMINTHSRTIETVVGSGDRGDGPDGDPLKCHLARPHGVFVDKDGAVFIGDSENQRVRILSAGN